MNKTLSATVAGFAVLALALTGCASVPGDTVEPKPSETNSTQENTPEAEAALNYEDKWANKEPVKLPFKQGEYSISYREESKLVGSVGYTADGVIGFYEDGTCAFDISGVKTDFSGEEIGYRIVKLADGYPLLREEGKDFWINDMLYIEYDFGTNLPVMGAFPKYRDISSWCALAMSAEIGEQSGAAKGYFSWELDKGSAFAAESKEWYFDYILNTLDIEPSEYPEAKEIIELTYYGLDTIFTYDGQGKIETSDKNVITISTGIRGESDLYVEIIMEPSKKNLYIEVDPTGEKPFVTNVQSLTNRLTADYKGIDYLRDIKKQIDEFSASNTGNN